MKYAVFFRAYFFILSIFIFFVVVHGHFILTSPKVLIGGSKANLAFIVFNASEGENVTFLLKSGKDIIAQSHVSVRNDYNMLVEMDIPPVSSETTGSLHIQANFRNGDKIDKSNQVRIRPNRILTLVQTDKPIYKPGQTIKFRVFPMDNQLRPLGSETVADIWIEDPSGTRVERWKEVKFREAIKQFELPLSEEPTLGTWKINTKINSVLSSQTFKVEKYVLPKFEVNIKAPSVVLADTDNVTIEVCAKYTYGKFVKGTASVKIDRVARRWGTDLIVTHVRYFEEISGCHEFLINMGDLTPPSDILGQHDGKSGLLKISTNVTERGTGIMGSSAAQIAITFYPLLIDFAGNNEYFKKSLPYYGQLRVQKPDGSPADAERIKICASFESDNINLQKCSFLVSDKSGTVHFSISPSSAGKIQLKASGTDDTSTHSSDSIFGKPWLRTSVGEMEIKPWFSPSESYLQILITSDELACEGLQHIKVIYNAEKGAETTFYYQILSRGRVVQQGSQNHTFESQIDQETKYDIEDVLLQQKSINEFILRFETKASMSPMIRLLVFYVRKDREIVADSKAFRVTQCLQNKVNLQFLQQQQYPGTEATMQLSASPHSLCGINMIDKSVKLLERKEKSFSTQKHIFELFKEDDISKLDKPQMDETTYCYEDNYKDLDLVPADEHRVLRRSAFPTERRKIILPWRNQREGYPYVDAVMAFEEAGTVFISDLVVKTKPCIHVIRTHTYDALIPIPERVLVSFHSAKKSSIGETDYQMKKPYQTKISKLVDEVRSYFPETWLWEVDAIDSTGEKTIERQLPHTITEWTGGAICVHPETGLGISQDSNITTFQPFFLDFQLPYSVVRGEALPLIVTVFNYLPQCLQVKLSLEPSENFKLLSEFRFVKTCVCGGQSESNKFLIRPVTLGKVNITVHAHSKEDDKDVCGNEVTASLNARDAITKQLLVEAEGFPKEDVLNYLICPENSNGTYTAQVDLLLPDDVVSESSRAYMTVTGDIMAPALNGLENLVKLPIGCGEQNMIRFVPNIFVLDYLKATGKATKDIEDKCINFMKIGYQRELQYRHHDGSYSAFGNNDKEGSLWLTAFVLRSFRQAKRFIAVDESDIRRSVNWILKMQNENGCFRSSGIIVHKEMKGGLGSGKDSLAPLTSYVLISLLESETEVPNQDVMRKGLTCLKSETNPDNYALALFAYACALAKDFLAAKKYLIQLDRQAVVVGNQKYWNSSSSSKSVSVEISSYYILTQLEINKSDRMDNSLPVVRWVTEQRNSNGGFISTQDTLVALQALGKYASYQSDSESNVVLTIKSDDLLRSLDVNKDNRLVTQSIKIPVLPAVLDLEANGNGCALVQFSVRYNVERVSDDLVFDLNVNANRLEGNDFNLTSLNICMRYNIINESSNMAILLVKMLSGFLPDESSLLELQDDPKVQLKRYETNENDVNFYFDELTNDQKCFNFKMMNEFEVEDVKPSIVRLYDYYQPEKAVFVEYSIEDSATESFSPISSVFPKDAEQLENDEPVAKVFTLDLTTEDAA